MKLFLRIFTVGLVIGLVWAGVRFIQGNESTIEVDYLFARSIALPVWQALILSFAIGWFAASLLFGYGWLRSKLETRRYRKAHARLEVELGELRGRSRERDEASGITASPTAALAGGESQRA